MDTKQQNWIQEKAIYTPDQLIVNGVEVMQDWEIPYMKKLASIATSNGGQVLELGFGLGLSAGFIQDSPNIKKHTIIEAHPDVREFAHQKFPEALRTGRMEIVPGFWQEVSSRFDDESFDIVTSSGAAGASTGVRTSVSGFTAASAGTIAWIPARRCAKRAA